MSSSPERDLVQMPLRDASVTAFGFTSHAGRDLPRSESDVIVGVWAAAKMRDLNPWLDADGARAAVRELDAVLAATTPDNLIERAKMFVGLLRNGVQVRVGNRKRSVTVADLSDPWANRWDIATEVTYRTSGGTKAVRFDIVLYLNGIPVVVTECKSMVDPHASWLTAAKDLTGAYTRRAPAFLAASIVQVATDGRDVRYGAAKTPAELYQRWGTTAGDRPADDTWEQVVYDFRALHNPTRLCDWLRDHVLHQSDRATGVLTRYIPRWPQSEAAPLIAARALDPDHNRGLLVHFQGSGKTLAMLMATNEVLRRDPRHLVVLVVDRRDLLNQHKHDFAQSDARRAIRETETVAELAAALKDPSASGIVITTVHRFAGVGVLSDRTDVTVMVDEAHRTQGTGEDQLGGQMRAALPNATLIGLTGTPVTKGDRNTFEAFGNAADDGQVLHRYTAADSVRDGTTVPLVIDRRRIVQALNHDEMDKAFAAYVEQEDISDSKAELLAEASTRWDVLLKDPRRIKLVAEDVASDLVANVLPGGYGAMLVVADREACVLYADALKKLLDPEQVTALISGNKNDPDSYDRYVRTPADEAALVRQFADPAKPLKLLVVTAKLLTGFDAKNCLATYIDKPMVGLTLFQAVTRVNRTWVNALGAEKGFGIVVDYCGVAPGILDAFSQSASDTTRVEVVSPNQLVATFKKSLTRAEKLLGDDFDWSKDFGNIVAAAKRKLSADNRLWRAFRQNVHRAELIFETLANSNAAVRAQKDRMKRLVRIVDAYGVTSLTEREALLMAHGPAVRALVLAHIGDPSRANMDLLQLTPERIRELVGSPGNPAVDIKYLQAGDVMENLRGRLKARMNGPHAEAYSSIAAKLDLFASTVYVETAEGVQQAAIDLVEIARQLKEVDDAVGQQWEELNEELFGWQRPTDPILDPKRALQQVLDDYAPQPMPAGLDDVAKVLDDLVETLSYKNLLDDVSAQKQLTRMVLRECARLGVLPQGKKAADEFVTQMVAYINAYLI